MSTNTHCRVIKNESQQPLTVPLVGGNSVTLPPGGSISEVNVARPEELCGRATVVRSLNEVGGSGDHRRRLNS